MGQTTNRTHIITLKHRSNGFVLNELSLEQSQERKLAHKTFQTLFDIFKKSSAENHGFQELKVPAAFFHHSFADNYMFYQWLNDGEIDADIRTFLKSKITTTPIIEEMIAAKTTSNDILFECRLAEKEALGFGAAYLFEAIAVSLSAATLWDIHEVDVQITTIDAAIETIENKLVRHIAKPLHFIAHSSWIAENKRRQVANGRILWLKKKDVFPNLLFCDTVKKQIETMNIGQPEFIQVINRLFELEKYASTRGTFFNPDNLPTKVTPESETRLRDYATQLIQTCPDGSNRLFSWHSRFTPGAGRIHFYPLETSNKIIIGSIANQNSIK